MSNLLPTCKFCFWENNLLSLCKGIALTATTTATDTKLILRLINVQATTSVNYTKIFYSRCVKSAALFAAKPNVESDLKVKLISNTFIKALQVQVCLIEVRCDD